MTKNERNQILGIIIGMILGFLLVYLLIPFIIGIGTANLYGFDENRKSCFPTTNFEKYFITHSVGCNLGKWFKKPIKQ